MREFTGGMMDDGSRIFLFYSPIETFSQMTVGASGQELSITRPSIQGGLFKRNK